VCHRLFKSLFHRTDLLKNEIEIEREGEMMVRCYSNKRAFTFICGKGEINF
jgi:hypothetical protein